MRIAIAICATMITVYAIPYIKALKNDKRYAAMLNMVDIAVRAAEQQLGAGTGKLKKERVMDFVYDWMSKQGVKITKEQLSELIEAAVFSMNKEG